MDRAQGQVVHETRITAPSWQKVPINSDYDHWLTIKFERKVLVIVRTVTSLTRLLDVLTLLESDYRIQTVFTFNANHPAIFSAGVAELLSKLKVTVIPWEQAKLAQFDLAIAASENDRLHEINAPILLIPHGIGYQKYYPRSRVVAGMDPERLLRNGRVVPAAIALSHSEQLALLQAASPQLYSRAVVIGDPCHDRLMAGIHRTSAYREALNSGDKPLIVLASTWGPGSLLGNARELPFRIVTELPYDSYRCCIILHPGITAAHSSWQIDRWLAEAKSAGLQVIPGEAGWQAALTAASCVVSDRGSLAVYAAALGKPVLMVGDDAESTIPGSPIAELAAIASRLSLSDPLEPQISLAIHRHISTDYEAIVKQAISIPGVSAEILRSTLYQLMNISEPDRRASFPPYEIPARFNLPTSTFIVGLEGSSNKLIRFPTNSSSQNLEQSHIVAHETSSTATDLGVASIVYSREFRDETTFSSWAEQVIREWPNATIAAAVTRDSTCLVHFRDGPQFKLSLDSSAIDPLLSASMGYFQIYRNRKDFIVNDKNVQLSIHPL
ncbi:hypothetical protein ACFQ73_07250 [Amycolatopsis japonica]|uniref:hypothetical protein n=1 Tax=Amycolatopsis japonica TaxID=208439 RepID=UPI00366AC075